MRYHLLLLLSVVFVVHGVCCRPWCLLSHIQRVDVVRGVCCRIFNAWLLSMFIEQGTDANKTISIERTSVLSVRQHKSNKGGATPSPWYCRTVDHMSVPLCLEMVRVSEE